MNDDRIELDELKVWNHHVYSYFLDVLNKDTLLEEAIYNIKSFRNSKYYTGTNDKYKKITDE